MVIREEYWDLNYGSVTFNGTSNYWLSTCNVTYGRGGKSSNTGAEKLTPDQMKVQGNFKNWDFNTIWKMDDEKEYPV